MIRTTPLNSTQHAACLLYASSVFLISILLKLTPAKWVEKLPIFLDENKAIDPNDPLMAAYNKQAKAKAVGKSDQVHAE
jgi:hypothetical protein